MSSDCRKLDGAAARLPDSAKAAAQKMVLIMPGFL
jgi:hypothetical protein